MDDERRRIADVKIDFMYKKLKSIVTNTMSVSDIGTFMIISMLLSLVVCVALRYRRNCLHEDPYEIERTRHNATFSSDDRHTETDA